MDDGENASFEIVALFPREQDSRGKRRPDLPDFEGCKGRQLPVQAQVGLNDHKPHSLRRLADPRSSPFRQLVRKINHPNVVCYTDANCFPFRRQHVLAMARRIDPFLQNKWGAAAC